MRLDEFKPGSLGSGFHHRAVCHIETAHGHHGTGAQRGSIAVYVAGNYIAVDIGKQIVGTKVRRQLRSIAKYYRNAISLPFQIEGNIVYGIFCSRRVNLDGQYLGGTAHAAQYGQNARTGAHVDNALACHFMPEDKLHH